MEITFPAWWVVPVAALASFAVGGLWYSPVLFGRPWQRLAGLSDADLAGRNLAAVFGGSLLCALVGSLVLALFVGGEAGPAEGAAAGAAVGLGWIATALVTTALFERRPLGLALVNGGYQAVAYTLMGLVIGAG
jgi:hypothetical protein